ncbi:MAG: hypothetical protein OXN84_14390 [Albidovulum sp.]|nr:hypothetical protein [Albidovulum sp.]
MTRVGERKDKIHLLQSEAKSRIAYAIDFAFAVDFEEMDSRKATARRLALFLRVDTVL